MTRPRFRRRSNRSRDSRRWGIEVAELAISLPVLTIITFGTLETCQLLFTKQSLAVAAYEAGRVAARPDGTTESTLNRFNQIATARRLQGANFTMTPADLNGVAVGESIRIDVTAPVSSNNSTHLVLFNIPDIVESVVVIRE
ncbi:TadE family protein [Botrimarina mediterranea]|uniref:TadE-like protein n=1 Tax=Botrimarina mediterranea TaxID=2528022 RepID=A0A518K6B8_9BACT|nr:TadE family protein [Botrimarina mediterranea]QDV73343.1 TadE-like protein [Botrimarina mediterranea]QDV77860.1 TadE-like protein [Planctomycetes bacterium K2D]